MATWKLSPQYKKNAVEKMFFYKDGKVITMEQGFRWATFSVQSDERPLTDEELKNEDGYELASIANDESWEMWDMIDGCWLEIEAGNDKTTDEDVEKFTELWEEDSYEAVEGDGWSQDDCEYFYYGPLELTNEDTGEVFKGEPDEVPTAPVEVMQEALVELEAETVEAVEGYTDLTDWYHKDHYYPTRPGRYQVTSYDSPTWPFPTFAEWDGKKWSDDKVISWRGLNNPAK